MFDVFNYVPLIFVVILFVMFAASAVRILPEYERGVLFRLGRLAGVRGPGLFFIIPGVDRLVKVSLWLRARIRTRDPAGKHGRGRSAAWPRLLHGQRRSIRAPRA